MAFVKTEMFAEFVYSQALTYDELHQREDALILFVEEQLQQHNADFINFEFMGDSLHAQCVFPAHNEDLCHSLCEAIAKEMDGCVAGRLLFVRKNLELLSFYSLSNGIWQEACMMLPPPGVLQPRH